MRKRGFLVNGQQLTELYQKRGWSQQDFAEKTGLDVRTIAKVKRGGTCDSSTLQRLAQTLGVTPDVLTLRSPAESDSTEADTGSLLPAVSEELKILQVWKVIDLRHPQKYGEPLSGVVWERYRILKRSDARPIITFPYLTWGDEIGCLQKPEGANWRRVPVEPGDIVHSDKQWELSFQAPAGPAGTPFDIGPIQLLFVNAFHGEQQQWWQMRIAYEIETLVVQVLFAPDRPCQQLLGTWAMPGQRKFEPLTLNTPHLLSDGSIANWLLQRPNVGSFFKISWTW